MASAAYVEHSVPARLLEAVIERSIVVSTGFVSVLGRRRPHADPLAAQVRSGFRFSLCPVRATRLAMGGLAGYFAPQSLDTASGSTLLGRMMDTLGERCPDSHRGTVSASNLGLGMRGPKTLPKGPYRNNGANLVWAVDGRIRLRSGASDEPHSEAIERLYMRWGEGVFRFIDGPFVLVIWDADAQQLTIGRDAFGQRPLFFTWVDGGRLLLFASEAKALLSTRKVEPHFDGRAFLDVLSQGHPLGSRSLIAGVHQLPAGSWLRADVTGRELHGQWFVSPYRMQGQKDVVRKSPVAEHIHEEAAAEAGSFRAICREILDPVPSRTTVWVKEDPASVLLAGLVAGAQTRLTLFHGGFDSKSGSKRFSLVEQLAERLEVEHASVAIKRFGAKDYWEVVRALELPILDSAALCEAQIYRAVARDKRNSLLSALGAEGVLYGQHVSCRTPGWWSRMFLPGRFGGVSGLARSLRNSWRAHSSYYRRWGAVPSELERWALIAHLADGVMHPRHSVPPGPSRWPHRIHGPPLLFASRVHRALRIYQKTVLEGALWRTDRLAACMGIEVHLPYLDRRMVTASARLSPGKLSHGRGMNVIRQALPNDLKGYRRLRERPLVFPNPIWPFGPGMSSWVRDILAPEAVQSAGFFDGQAVEDMLDRLSKPRIDPIAPLEASVLNGVLGFQLLAKNLGITDVRWSEEADSYL